MRMKRRQDDTKLELTPLIDVVFLLLVFFVFALVLMVRADVLDLRLPEVGSGETARRGTEVRVTLTEAGSVLVNGRSVEAEGAGDAVLGLLAETPDALVVLSADERARAGALIELADALVAAGVNEFSVLGSPSGSDTGTGGAEEAPMNPGAGLDE